MTESSKIRSKKIINICDKAGKFLIYFLVFSLPLFFLPITYDPLDFNKQFFLGILIFIALIFWLVRSFFASKFEVNLSLINISVLILILVNLLSLFFSYWRYSSFWGWPFNVSQGFLTLIYFFIVYFLIINYFDKKKEIVNLFSTLILSAFFVSIFSIFNIFGKPIFPWVFSKTIFFNTIGSVNSLALFLAILFPLGFSGAMISKGFIRRMLLIAIITFSVLFFLINSKLAWIVLTANSAIVFIFGLLNLKKGGEINLVFLPMIFLIISLTFLAFLHPINFLENTLGFSLPKFLPEIQFPVEISVNQSAEFSIVKNSFKNLKNLFLGIGPSNFFFDYLKHKPIGVNATQFWDTKFQVGASEILDRLIATGVLGIISLFSVFLVFFWQIGKNLSSFPKRPKEKSEENIAIKNPGSFNSADRADRDWLINIGIFSSFISMVIGFFIYPANVSLMFLFWFILAISVVFSQKIKKRSISSFSVAVFLTLVFIIGMIISFSLIKNYQAEVKYLAGLDYLAKLKTEEAIVSFEKSLSLNPKVDVYWREISQVYLSRLNEVSQDQKLSKEEIGRLTQELTGKAVNAAEKASELSPENSLNWINKGSVYENLITKSPGDNTLISSALDFYKRANDLEPSNPQIFTSIGQIYIQKSDILQQQKGQEKEIQESLNMAIENLQKALELKPDFVSADVQIAGAFQREGKIKEAIDKLTEATIFSPSDPFLAYQLGILYYGQGNNDLAKISLERAVKLDQNYSNARYFLGLIYDKEGNKEKAIEQFEWIEKLNPENQEIKVILNNLKEGKPAF